MRKATKHAAILALSAFALSACAGDPLKDVPKLSDVDMAEPTPVVEAVAAPVETDKKAGFFQRLMRKREVAPEPAQGDTAPAAQAEPDAASTTGAKTGADAERDDAPLAQDAAAAEPAAAPKKRGFRLFGLGGARKQDRHDDASAAPAETLQKAALTLEPQAGAQAEAEKEARRGLFGASKARRLTGPDAREAVPGEVLPFGEVARACHVKRGQLGKEVAKYPEKRAKYHVYDSAPGHQGLHTFYVTGFKDGCPRQFTAALAVFGTAGMYEALRYGLPVKARTKKPTDIAYEKLKSRTCGVSKTKPCGAKIGKMEKQAVFLSLYNRFVGAQGWTNLLISDGALLARDSAG